MAELFYTYVLNISHTFLLDKFPFLLSGTFPKVHFIVICSLFRINHLYSKRPSEFKHVLNNFLSPILFFTNYIYWF